MMMRRWLCWLLGPLANRYLRGSIEIYWQDAQRQRAEIMLLRGQLREAEEARDDLKRAARALRDA